ncbi:MAG TPA: phenylalanine--tRNA ligase subunit beta, partial [Phycicoccus sp.]
TVQASTLATYPMAQSDVALVVERSVPAVRVRDALVAGGGELLEAVHLFDVYEGEQVGPDHKSLAYRLVFRSPERTLTTEEVSGLRDAAVAAAATAVGAVQRA